MGRKKKIQEPIEEQKPNEDIVAPNYDSVTEGYDPKDTKKEDTSEVEEVTKLKTNYDEKAFKKTLSLIDKEFGEGTIISADALLAVEKVSTKNLLLDILTEGGLPKGAITLIYGKFSSGKTVSALLLASVYTKQKIPVLYIAAEGDIDKKWVQKLGNDLKYFHITKPDNLEKAINLADIAVRSKQFGLVIFDSVTAGIPKESLDKKSEQDQMALQARRNTKLVQKLSSGLQPENLTNPDSYNNTAVVLIGHIRYKIGMVYGDPITIPGGTALVHHSAYIIYINSGARLKKGEEIIGQEVRIKIQKSKYSTPLVSGVTEFFFKNPRFNNAKVLITYATQLGIIDQAGPYYSYKDIKVQGKDKLLIAIKEQNLLAEIKEQLIRKFNNE